MKRVMKLLLLVSLIIATTYAKELKVESSLVTGKLENGFEYTIKENAKPSKKVEMLLYIGAGALEEDDDQNGVAHLLEHMAFKGGKNFPNNSLVSYLESLGLAFGSHVNATTDTSYTLYNLSVPLEKENLQKSFLAFHDWAGGLELKESELEKERAIVIEEARMKSGLWFRNFLKRKDTIYADSKYKDRTVIGDLDIIKNIKIDRVKDFYTKWYRPQLMHLVVVGDIDAKEIVPLIKQSFSHLKNNNNEKVVSREVPIQNKTRVLFIDDDEVVGDSVSLNFFVKKDKVLTQQDLKKNLLVDMALQMFNYENINQLSKQDQKTKKIVAHRNKIASNQEMIIFEAIHDNQNKKDVLDSLVSSIYRSQKYGFSQESFDAIKKAMLGDLEFRHKTTLDSQTYAREIVYAIESGNIFIDEELGYELFKKILNEVTIKDIQKSYSMIVNSDAQLVEFVSQSKDRLSDDDVFLSIKNAKANIKKPRHIKELPKKVLSKDLETKKIILQTYNKEFDYWEFVLENGAKVIYKFNDYQKNSVNFYAHSEGGYSLVDDRLLYSAKNATQIVADSGTKKFTKEEITKINTGKQFALLPFITRYSEGFEGGSSTKDLEELLSWVYILSTDFRVDEVVLENIKRTLIAKIEQEKKTPKVEFYKEYEDFYMNNHPRFKNERVEDIKSINKEDVLRVYADRFADANNFTYFIVGDVEYEKVKTLASKYLANLPTTKRQEIHKDRDIKSIQPPKEFIRFYENQNISTLNLLYEKEEAYTYEESLKLKIFRDILDVKIMEQVRGEKAGIYAVHTRAYISRLPYEKARIEISFTCDPKRRVELLSLVKEIVESLKDEPVSAKYVQSAIKKGQLYMQEDQKTSGFWIQNLISMVVFGDNLADNKKRDSIFAHSTPAQMQKIAQKYLQKEHLIYNELNPKEVQK